MRKIAGFFISLLLLPRLCFAGVSTEDSVKFKQIATPSNPAANYNKLYFKSDNNAYTLTSAGTEDTVARIAATQTLTNKRITKRDVTTTQSATPTINTDNTDCAHITGLAQAITSMTTNLSGTPVAGDVLRIDITDNGTARAITWGASFEASTVALPTTTVISTRLDIGFVWNEVTTKWRCVAVA